MAFLDFNLRRVAKLRQVTIKTARDWRDGENRKWFSALEELKELKRKTGRDIIDAEPRGFFSIGMETPDIQDIPEIRKAVIELESFSVPPL
jgi:hypothetical protein